MKRVFHLFFILIYIVISSGFTTSKHICTGNSSEIKIGLKNLSDLDCSKCTANKKKNHSKCCKLEVKKIQKADNLTYSHKNTSVKFLHASIPYNTLGTVFDKIEIDQENSISFFDFSEYHFNYPSLYILHCVYRI
jgi:hypothetical protein